LADDLSELGERRGLDVGDARPRALDDLRSGLADFDLIVSLEGDPRPHLGEVPFHTVVLEWDAENHGAPIDDVARAIAAQLQQLIELLRGDDAE
jgi:hypothetical protein